MSPSRSRPPRSSPFRRPAPDRSRCRPRARRATEWESGAPAGVVMRDDHENRTGRPTRILPCGGQQPTCCRLGAPAGCLPSPRRPSTGSARRLGVRAQPSARGVFLVLFARSCGMLLRPPCPACPEEESVARRGQRQTGARRTAPRTSDPSADRDDVISVLARAVREVEAAVQRGRATPAVRTKFQAVALLVREERARVRRTRPAARASEPSSSSASTASRRSSPRPPPGTPGSWRCSPRTPSSRDAARSLKRDLLRRGRDRGGARGGDAGRAPGHLRRRAPGRAAVGGLPPAGQPLPRARLLRAPTGPGPSAPAGQLGAARPAARARSSAPVRRPRRAWRCPAPTAAVHPARARS